MAGTAARLRDAFARVYGTAPARIFRGPGRVNLIGEHTDYNLGFVLPMALEMAVFMGVAPNGTGRLRVWSEEQQASREWAVDALASLAPAHDWGDYIAGVAREIVRAGVPLEGADLLIHSTVPVGAGLSSSAALETATALALLGGRPIERLELVRLCHRAENEFVGLPCGTMDQYVSVFGRANAAIKIDCRSLEHEIVELPAGVAILAVNTMVKHELGQSAYRDRVRECREAVEAIRAVEPRVESLRDVSPVLLESNAGRVPPAPLKRARHVVSENARVEAFIDASRRGDVKSMGQLFVGSHHSLQVHYEVSCEELDFLVDTAVAIPGVFGARMTGGGFGGCTVNLVRAERVAEFRTKVEAAYRDRFGITPQIYECRPAEGAGAINP